MPYRIDLHKPPDDAFDRLVALGALDIEPVADGLAALIPDAILPEDVRRALSSCDMTVSEARARDGGSVWILQPRPVRVGRLLLVPAGSPAPSGAIALTDGVAFGTGLHPTTALCLEALDDIPDNALPDSVLDIGCGSGVLALAALAKGVPEATGIDIDPGAIQVAAENARLNNLEDRLHLVSGTAESVTGTWPLVFANILAAPLMEMAPVVVRRVAHEGRLVLSGIPGSAASEVERTYRNLGMRPIRSMSRAGWTAVVLYASW